MWGKAAPWKPETYRSQCSVTACSQCVFFFVQGTVSHDVWSFLETLQEPIALFAA